MAPSPLLHVQPLPSGRVVRMRLPHRTDAAGVIALCARLGVHVDDVEATRLLRFDPRRSAMAVAFALEEDGLGETMVGLGRMDHGDEPEPELVLSDPACDGLPELLERALRAQAAARARRAA